MLPKETRTEIAAQLLNFDNISAQQFCNMPIKNALNQYAQAIEKAYNYPIYTPDNAPLPIGTYFRLSYDNCSNLQQITNSIHNDQEIILAEHVIIDIDNVDDDIKKMLLNNQTYSLDLPLTEQRIIAIRTLSPFLKNIKKNLHCAAVTLSTCTSICMIGTWLTTGELYLPGDFIIPLLPYIAPPTIASSLCFGAYNAYQWFKNEKNQLIQQKPAKKFLE